MTALGWGSGEFPLDHDGQLREVAVADDPAELPPAAARARSRAALAKRVARQWPALWTEVVNVRRARPDLPVTRQQPGPANLSLIAQKCGDFAAAPGPNVNRNRRACPSSRLPRIVSFACAALDPHHGTLVLSEPSG
jgi:hypothetical protein